MKKKKNKKINKKPNKQTLKFNKKANKVEENYVDYNYDNIPHKKEKRINKLKVGIIILILFIVLMFLLYAIIKLITNPTDTFVVTKGEISQWETVTGYIVREESVVKGENYKNGIIKIKEEGEKVAKGESIYRYYASGEEEIKNKIAELDNQIQTVMENQEAIPSSDIKLLEARIEEQISALDGINSIQKIQEYKKNINSYITKKAQISGELSPSGSTLKQLIEQRNTYENTLISSAEYVNAPESGVVSYKVDGLEEVLTPESFGNINKKLLENLNLKTAQIVPSSEELGKIINNYKCYIILNSESEQAKQVNIGDTIQIMLQDSQTTSSSVVNIIEEDDQSRTITIQIEKNVENLIAYRKISFDIIWWKAEGYRVTNDALCEVDGLTYVVRNRNGYYDKMLVKVLKQNDEFSIVSSYSSDELKELGFTSSDIYKMKNIALYDEIIVNPTEEQLLQ